MNFDPLSGLLGILLGLVSLSLIYRRRHARVKAHRSYSSVESLHWNPLVERRGLGGLLIKLNHIAITVSDVGKSLNFYVDILGLQQIRRPSFDRHGAWLTMGNLELHLIKGIPAPPPVDNLQVSHLAFETTNITEVLNKLRQLNIDVRQSLNVTNAQKSVVKDKPVITQYFFNDPDGYFIELCNCDVLTQFSLGSHSTTTDPVDYHEGIRNDRIFAAVQIASHWKRMIHRHSDEDFEQLLNNTPRANEIDEKKFNNLIQRRTVYGDIIQGFSDDDIREALLQSNNIVPLMMKILIRKRGERIYFRPASFIEHGETVEPEPFTMNLHQYHS